MLKREEGAGSEQGETTNKADVQITDGRRTYIFVIYFASYDIIFDSCVGGNLMMYHVRMRWTSLSLNKQ